MRARGSSRGGSRHRRGARRGYPEGTGDRGGAIHDVATNRAFSYAETAQRAARIGTWLRSPTGGGLALGARVGVLAPNGAAVLEAHFACAWAGLVVLNCSRRRETQARGVAHPQTGRGAAAAAT